MAVLAAHAQAQVQSFRDADWNTTFADSCGLPSGGAVRWITFNGDRKLEVT